MNTPDGNRPAQLVKTAVCDLLRIRHPIVLGGMAGGTNPELVAAVSNTGGLGIYGASRQALPDLRRIVARIRELTQAPFGLNLLLFHKDDALLDAVLAEHPHVFSTAWATIDQPLGEIFTRAHAAGSKVMHNVATVDEARRAAEAGADIIVAQGTEGGGHVGVMGTVVLTPMVVDAVKPLPVLTAGGIADGRGLAAALALGADGVLVGTRFLATPESPIHPNMRQAIIDSDGHDTDLTEVPDLITGRVWPGAFSRVRRNALIREWTGREWEIRQKQPLIYRDVLAAMETGDVERRVLFFGQDAGLIDSIEPAEEIVLRIVREAHEILSRRLPTFFTS